jgi:hypothetical protein
MDISSKIESSLTNTLYGLVAIVVIAIVVSIVQYFNHKK